MSRLIPFLMARTNSSMVLFIPLFSGLFFMRRLPTHLPTLRHIFVSLYDGGLGEAFHGPGMGAPNDLPSGLSLV